MKEKTVVMGIRVTESVYDLLTELAGEELVSSFVRREVKKLVNKKEPKVVNKPKTVNKNISTGDRNVSDTSGAREWRDPFYREGRTKKVIQPKWLEKKANTPNPVMSRKGG